MKHHYFQRIALLAGAALTLATASCNQQSARIEGRIEGGQKLHVYLKKNLMGKLLTLDSAQLDDKGYFAFRVAKPEVIDFYQLTLDTLASITVLLRPADHVKLRAQMPNLLATCTAPDSPDMALMLELQQKLAQSNAALDSLLNKHGAAADMQPKEVRNAIGRIFIRQKQHNTTFIVKHITSPASILAYTQRLGRDVPLFGSLDDRFLLRALTDSLRVRYPRSNQVNTLLVKLDELELMVQRSELQDLLANATELDKPEITLPDLNGQTQCLSDFSSKVVLIHFWVSTNKLCLMDNRELLDIYADFHDSGFEVFQVSLDDDLERWRSVVAEHQLPWISVSCPASQNCKAAQDYVVNKVPASYLIARDGTIVGKDLLGNELIKAIRVQLAK
jgi:peroxiredoxin